MSYKAGSNVGISMRIKIGKALPVQIFLWSGYPTKRWMWKGEISKKKTDSQLLLKLTEFLYKALKKLDLMLQILL